jgi:hypothetical protein
MSTLDECRKCRTIYQVSGFFPPDSEIPEEFTLLDNVTTEQWDKLRAKYPYSPETGAEYGYWCPWCVAKEIKTLG